MTRFRFTAVDVDGNEVTGIEDADTMGEARIAIAARDLRIVEVQRKKGLLELELTKKKLPRKELMHFTRQMAVFVRAGIPILDALDVILEEASNKVLRDVLTDISIALRGGDTFADAIAAHPQAFPNMYVSFLRSAELTGDLDTVLDQLADYIERDMDARKKLTSAMVYPGIVASMAVVTVVIMAVFVLPRFKTFFDNLDAELPLPTRMLLAVTNWLTEGWPIIALVVAAFVALVLVGMRTEAGRPHFDAILLRIPGVGGLVRQSVLERLCRVLASMTTAGVPLPDAMAVASDASNNHVYKTGLNEVREAMIEGHGLAGPLAASGLLPGAARQMVKVGEETGTLGDQLESAAKYLDRELDYKIKSFTNLFEPLTIVFVGVVVGFVAIALVSAMYGVYGQVDA